MGEGNGYPLQYSCLENPMDRGDPVPLEEGRLGDWSAAWEGQVRPGQAAGWGSLRDQARGLSRENKGPISTTWGFGRQC